MGDDMDKADNVTHVFKKRFELTSHMMYSLGEQFPNAFMVSIATFKSFFYKAECSFSNLWSHVE